MLPPAVAIGSQVNSHRVRIVRQCCIVWHEIELAGVRARWPEVREIAARGFDNEWEFEARREYLEIYVKGPNEWEVVVWKQPEKESDVKSLSAVVEDEILSLVKDDNRETSSVSIISATRIGKLTPGKQRLVILIFDKFEDKIELFRYRDELKFYATPNN